MTDTKMNQIADKIQKLLSLAGNNPSAEEAQAALLKAQELMAKYNIEVSASDGAGGYTYDMIETNVKSHKFNDILISTIAASFAVRAIILYIKKLAVFGRSDNAKAAASAFEFAYKTMVRGGNKATREAGVQPGHKGAAHYYNSYVIGFINGLKSALDAQTVALAVVVPDDVNAEFNNRFTMGKEKRYGKTAAAYNRSIYNSGFSDGSKVMDKRSIQA